MNQQLLTNGAQTFSYGQNTAVPAAGSVVVCEFDAPELKKIIGVSLGLGLSDVTAWGAGAQFDLVIDGTVRLTITDQISDLLRMEFIPMNIYGKSNIGLVFTNGTAAAIDVAAIIRVEAF